MSKKLNFTESNKDFIQYSIRTKTLTVTQLAIHYGCHPKSINRVMLERGVGAISTKAKSTTAADNARVKKLLKDHNVSVDQLETLLITRQRLRERMGVDMAMDTSVQASKDRTADLFRPGAQTAHAVS